MNIFENILLSLNGLRTSKMRSFLTMLGIIIGIGSVIAIVTVGQSMTSSVTSSMKEMGANVINIRVETREANSNLKIKDDDLITDDMIQSMIENFGSRLSAIELTESVANGQVKTGYRYANVSITGANDDYMTNGNDTPMIQGRDIKKMDVQRVSNVCVVSSKFVEKMFPYESPIGKEISVETTNLGRLTFTIIGVYEYKAPAFMSNFVPDDDVSTEMVIPVSTAIKINGSAPGYAFFRVKYSPETEDVAKLEKDIGDYLNKFYKSNQYFHITTYNMKAMLDQMNTMLSTISIAVSIIAGISLLVGGIGVMNIMLVSVTERTREIGTRKALGATTGAIRMQFIIESMILCLIGGIIGVALGLLLGMGGASLLNFPASPGIPIILIAVGFSMVIGVFFGYYPANKAAQLDPIEALRYE